MDSSRVTRTSTRHSQEVQNSNLRHAARSGKFDDVKELLQSRADINSEGGGNLRNGEDHQTALSLAAIYDNVQIVQLLLEKDAAYDREDYSHRTPLSWAAEMGHSEIAQLLLDKKADIEKHNLKAQTPLSLAAEKGHSKVVRLLLEKNAYIEARNDNQQTPLFVADHPEVVRLLLEKNAQIKDSVGKDHLAWAAKNGHLKIVQLLLDKDAKLEGEGKRTPLSLSARKGYAQIVKLLLEKKAKVDNRDEDARTPLSLTAEKGQQGHTKVAQLLLENKARIEEKCWGQTPLSFAAENGNLQIVKLLLEKEAEIKTTNASGQTPFDLAKENGHDKIAVLLLRHESKGNWNVEQLRKLIRLHNQDVIVEEIKRWPKSAIVEFETRQQGMFCAPLPERLRPVLAPQEKDPTDLPDEDCAAMIHSSNVEKFSQENFLWAPDVAVTLKVLPGVKGSDAIDKKFLQTLGDTPHESIFETDAMQAMILAAWQQERFSTWIGIASCISMVISLCVCSYGFRHGEGLLANTFLGVAAVLHGKKSLNEVVQLLSHLGKKCSHGTCSHWCFKSWNSHFDNRYSRSYINFDNVADLLYIGSGWAAIWRQMSCPSSLEKPCMSMFSAFSWLRLVYSLRGEIWIGPRLLPILSAIKDTFAFFFLMTICIVAASHAYYNLELRDLETKGQAWPTYSAFMQIVNLGIFSDFDMFEFEGLEQTYTWKYADNASVLEPQHPDPGPHHWSAHALFYITGVGITVLLMNVLISVLSENYSKYAEKKKATGQFLRARVKILVDVQSHLERRVWNRLKECLRERSQCQCIAQPKGDSQTKWLLCAALRSFGRCLCVALFPVSSVIWFLFHFFDLNINCLVCQLRYACGSFGYAPLRDQTPDQEGTARLPTTEQKMKNHKKERRRAAAEQCAIFFVVRDELDINNIQSLRPELKQQIESLDAIMQAVEKTVQRIESLDARMQTVEKTAQRIESLDARMQTVEKTVGRTDSKMETLEHRLGGQIETGFKKVGELIAEMTRRSERLSEMSTDSSTQ